MRVISQDGTIDVPYEISSFSMACGKYKDVGYAAVYCHNSSTAAGTKMAEYSSKEKAKKAMEELRYAYMCSNLAKMGKTPPDEIDEKLTMGLNGVFEFPAEEELE
uniref:hypothetical protein n=1 Tax=Roseburia inulinivorans TaxID=360807 RepID=UPI0040388D6C